MKISMIACMSRNRVIGKDGKMPWHISSDLRRFRELTMDNAVVMGRKTYESIGRPLDGRVNIIMSTSQTLRLDDRIVCVESLAGLENYLNDLDKALNYSLSVFIIGGESVYKELMPIADRLYLTIIDHDYDGDTHFPEIEPADWNLISCKTGHNDNFPHNFAYITLDRVKT